MTLCQRDTRHLALGLLALALPAGIGAQTLIQPISPAVQMNLAPNLVPVTPPAGTVHDQPITLAFKVRNVKAGSPVRVLSFLPTRTDCIYRVANATGLPSATAGADGIATFSVPGMFSIPAGVLLTSYAGPCKFVAQFSYVDIAGRSATSTFESAALNLAPGKVHVVGETQSWLPKLKFTSVSSSGTCSGTSTALGGGTFKVGILDKDDSGATPADITFSIRSGPSGTRCRWASQPLVLPASMRLSELAFTRVAGTCKATVATQSVATPGVPLLIPLTALAIRSAENPIRFQTAAIGAHPLGAGLYANAIAGISVSLDCDPTLSNDKSVTIKLDSLTFVSAQGVNLP